MASPDSLDTASRPAPNASHPPPAGASPPEKDLRIYKPASWLERLDLLHMFDRPGPLEVELGSGDGSFLIEWAKRHPDRNFIGVERLLGRVRKLDRKSQRAGLSNVRGLRIEASYCVEYLLPPACASAIHVYFPDPWPKRRHHKNRLVTERFATLVGQALKPGACIHLRTDNTDYIAQMRASFDACPGFQLVSTPDDLAVVTTDFERGFLAEGIPTQHASYAWVQG